MRDRLIELLNVDMSGYDGAVHGDYIENIADYLIANGVIVPPCKVGQKIYRVYKDKVWEWQIVVVEVYPDEIALVDDSDNYIKPEEIGKTVFLTREEAEAKLKGEQ